MAGMAKFGTSLPSVLINLWLRPRGDREIDCIEVQSDREEPSLKAGWFV